MNESGRSDTLIPHFISLLMDNARKWTLILVSITFVTGSFLSFFASHLRSSFIVIARTEATNIASYSLNYAVTKMSAAQENLIGSSQPSSDNLLVSVDSSRLNQINAELARHLQGVLYALTSGTVTEEMKTYLPPGRSYDKGIIEYIPLSMAFNNFPLSWMGPKLPVKLKLIGDAVASAQAQVTNYGINNVLVEVVSSIKVRVMVIIPGINDINAINVNVPLAMFLVQGEVPLYYQGSYDLKNGGVSLPLV